MGRINVMSYRTRGRHARERLSPQADYVVVAKSPASRAAHCAASFAPDLRGPSAGAVPVPPDEHGSAGEEQHARKD
jgi:hypothetical protein